MEPVDDPPADPEPTRVEVTFATDPATYDRLAPRLDALAAEFDLMCHVRRTGEPAA